MTDTFESCRLEKRARAIRAAPGRDFRRSRGGPPRPSAIALHLPRSSLLHVRQSAPYRRLHPPPLLSPPGVRIPFEEGSRLRHATSFEISPMDTPNRRFL